MYKIWPIISTLFLFSCSTTAHMNPTSHKGKFTRSDVVQFAEQYIGIPYQKDGKSPATGFDCSGFVAYIYHNFGRQLKGGSSDIALKGKSIDQANLKPGDLVFFGEHKKISHIGIVSANANSGIEMIHSSSTNGITREVFTNSVYWRDKFLFAKDILSKN